MSLRTIANGLARAVNPDTLLTLKRGNGYTTNADGSRVPAYKPPVSIFGQAQAATSAELRQVDGLNLQGTHRTVYLGGKWHGIVRAAKAGGDVITFPDGSVWLVTGILERWPGWTKTVITLQTDGAH